MRRGELHFPEGNCCDMTGAIALFTSIHPEVELIVTYAGKETDTAYRKFSTGWAAKMPHEEWTK